jgi:hypothetical protein
MKRFDINGLGEVPLFVNKGVVAEFETYFDKPWIQLAVLGFTNKHWFVLMHKAYEMACYRLKNEIEHSLKDFEAFVEDDQFTEIVKFLDLELDRVLEISKITKELNKEVKKKMK